MNKKVLIVEDERLISQALSFKLKQKNIDTECAYDGNEALKMLEKNTFDLVLLDLIMPGQDGFFILNELNKRKDKTPVIVTSNLSQDKDIEETKRMGVIDYIIKANVSLSQIADRIQKALE